MVSWIDLLPTLIDLGGGEAVDGIDGRSFAGVLRGKSDTHRDRIFATHTADGKMNQYPIRCVRTRDWHYILNLEPGAMHTTHIDKAENKDGLVYWRSWEMLARTDAQRRRRRRPLSHAAHGGALPMRTDPYELRNLAGKAEHEAVREGARQRVERLVQNPRRAGQVTGMVAACLSRLFGLGILLLQVLVHLP